MGEPLKLKYHSTLLCGNGVGSYYSIPLEKPDVRKRHSLCVAHTLANIHKMANAHRRRNCLNNICINDRKIDKEVDIKEGLVDTFQNLLSAPSGWSPSLPDLNLNRIGFEEAASLEETFSKNEIWTAIYGLNSDKAPSPDGFPLAFWSFSWDFVKNEVIGFFKEFHDNSRFVKNLNTTFLVLIPKKQTVEDFKDLRPISLVGGLYKILSKVLANRIKRIMDKVISKSQNAFVEGR